jgi:hypothetical protein
VARSSPEQAAAQILQGVERREPRILVGPDAWKIDLLARLKPATYWTRMAKRYDS